MRSAALLLLAASPVAGRSHHVLLRFCFGLFVHCTLGQLGQLLVGRPFFVEGFLKKAGGPIENSQRAAAEVGNELLLIENSRLCGAKAPAPSPWATRDS